MADKNEITLFERTRIQVEAMIPIVRAMEKEIGVERTHELVREAMDQNSRTEIEKSHDGQAPLRMPFNSAGLDAGFAAGNALRYDLLREDADAFEFNVTGCQYKAMMEELGALDLGGLLLCNADFATADAMGLELVRTQTCMQGASHCDFRYRIRKS